MAKTEESDKGGMFFPDLQRESFSTGSTTLDLSIQGYAEGQIISVFGKSGTGKSLFMLEAAANFIRKYDGNCLVRIHDTENAYSRDYAANFVPVGKDCLKFTDPDSEHDTTPRTVEDVHREVDYYCSPEAQVETLGCPVLIIIDSWDALSCEAELERDVSDRKTMKMDKAKIGREFARVMTPKMAAAGVTLMIASQSQMAFGAGFTYETRSGGSWLEFYPTQVLKIKYGESVANTRDGFKRDYGRWLEVVVVKNRRQGPRPPVKLFLMFDFGLDDLMTCAQFVIDSGQARRLWDPKKDKEAAIKKLKGAKRKEMIETSAAEVGKEYIRTAWKFDQEGYEKELQNVREVATGVWNDIEQAFAPRRKKYG